MSVGQALADERSPYHEGSALLLVRARQERHRVYDLDARVVVDVDAVRIFFAEYSERL